MKYYSNKLITQGTKDVLYTFGDLPGVSSGLFYGGGGNLLLNTVDISYKFSKTI